MLHASVAQDTVGAGAGRIDWSFAASDFDPLPPGVPTPETFGVTITDSMGHSATQSVTLTLTALADPPTAAPVAFQIAAGASADESATILAAAHPADAGDTLTLTAIDTTGTQGKVTLDPLSHALNYAASASTFTSLLQGQSVTDHFGYTVTDQSGQSGHAVATVTVNGVVPAGPVANGDTLTASPGGSLLDGKLGYTHLIGGPGDDTLIAGTAAPTTLSGGGGNDIFSVNKVEGRLEK